MRGVDAKVLDWVVLLAESDSIHAGVSEPVFYVRNWNQSSINCRKAAYK